VCGRTKGYSNVICTYIPVLFRLQHVIHNVGAEDAVRAEDAGDAKFIWAKFVGFGQIWLDFDKIKA